MRKKGKNNIINVDFAQYQSKRNISNSNHHYKDIENFSAEYSNDNSYQTDEKRKVFVLHPVEYSDVQQVADDLIKYETVIIVLKAADYEERKRIMDFVFGVCYALQGTIHSVSSDTFIASISNNINVAIPYID